jgi:hypothetical protein
MTRALLIVPIALAALLGCTSTTVKLNPSEHDRGFRFYRPKPYLFVQPTADVTDGIDAPKYVTIEWMMLPDFSEQYSLHARAGLGRNGTKITLDNGWNLTKVDYDMDSKFDDNVKAIGGLVSAAGNLFGKSAAPTKGAQKLASASIKARNVPFGFYEAVIGHDPTGVKRMYGFRYIGFMPYGQCPINATGAVAQDCNSSVVYGLVYESGATVFKALDDIKQDYVPIPKPKPVTKEDLAAALNAIRPDELKEAVKPALTNGNSCMAVANTATSGNTVSSVVFTTQAEADVATIKTKLKPILEDKIKASTGFNDITVTVTDVKKGVN